MSSSFPAVIVRQIGATTAQAVNARDLHAFLGIGRDFSSWIKDRIDGFGFDPGSDFAAFDAAPQNGGAGNRGIRTEYALSIDMAKELSMVERSPKGKEVRQYFIECERSAKGTVPALLPDFSNPAIAARAWAEQYERRDVAEQRVAALEPKAVALDRLTADDEMILISDAAKRLDKPIKDVFAWLRANKWIFRRTGSKRDIGYADKLRAGLLVHKYHAVPQDDGPEILKEQVHLTPKGLAHLATVFGREVSK
jgi:phage anti-repressor protein/phage antirepressor YoqD-like protein